MSLFTRWLRQPSVKIFLSVVTILGFSLPQVAAAAMLSDGVVVDPPSSMAYMMTETGIDAVDLAAGAVLWSTAGPAKPLIVFDNLLIAQARAANSGSLPIIGFDLSDGSRRDLATIELPENLWASIVDGPVAKFRTHASAENGQLHVSWLATRVKAQGQMQGYLLDGDDDEGAAISGPAKSFSRLQGAARLDLTTGQSHPLSEAKLASLPGSSNLGLASHKPLKGIAGRQFTSVDGRHILASERIAGNSEWNSYRWTLYDLAGTQLGMVDHHLAVAPFQVMDGSLFYESRPFMRVVGDQRIEQPLQLKAIDLASGTELWAKTMPETEFVGPYAP